MASAGSSEGMRMGTIKLKQPLGIGTLQWGTTWVDEKMVKGGRIHDATVDAIVAQCLAAGVTFFDSAEGYGGGTSEARLGRAVAALGRGGRAPGGAGDTGGAALLRAVGDGSSPEGDAAAIATKFLPTFWRCTRGALVGAARRSREILQLPRIPMYFIHTPVHWLPVEFWIEAACDAKDAGIIENIGVSNFDADQIRRAHTVASRRGHSIAANQVMFGLLNFQNECLAETIRVCKDLGIAIVAFSPIGQGLLTDKFTPESLQTNRIAKMTKVSPAGLERLRAEMALVAQEADKSMAQVALNWVICHDCIPLIGCRTTRQAEDTLGCLGWRLTDDQVRRLDEVALAHSTLTGKKFKRIFFANLFGMVMIVCRCLSWIYGTHWSPAGESGPGQ